MDKLKDNHDNSLSLIDVDRSFVNLENLLIPNTKENVNQNSANVADGDEAVDINIEPSSLHLLEKETHETEKCIESSTKIDPWKRNLLIGEDEQEKTEFDNTEKTEAAIIETVNTKQYITSLLEGSIAKKQFSCNECD